MGLFDKMLKRTWYHFRDRGLARLEKGEYGLACQELRESLRRFKGDEEEKRALQEHLREAEASARKRLLERAEEARSFGDFDRARRAYDSALEYSNTDEERQAIQAALETLDATPEPLTGLDAEVVIDPTELPEEHRLEVFLGALEPATAMRYRELGDDFATGVLAIQEGRFEAAITQLRASLEAEPDEPIVRLELGRALHGAEQLDEALEHLASAADALPEDIPVRLHLARAQWGAKDWEGAEATLQAAHDIDPEDATVFRAIGEHALLTGDLDPGIEALQMLLEDQPRDVPVRRMLGQLFHARGDLDAALECYEAIQEMRWSLDPESRELVFDPFCALQAAHIYIQQERRLDRAIDLLFALLSITRGAGAANIHAGIAKAFRLKEKPAKAREHLEQALALLGPDDDDDRADYEQRLAELD